MNNSHMLKRYKIIFEFSDVRTHGDSMNSTGRIGVKLEFISVHTKKHLNEPNIYAQT